MTLALAVVVPTRVRWRPLAVVAGAMVLVLAAWTGPLHQTLAPSTSSGGAVSSVGHPPGVASEIARVERATAPPLGFRADAGGYSTTLAPGVPVLVAPDGAFTLDDPRLSTAFSLTPVGVGRAAVAPLVVGSAEARGAHLTEQLGALTSDYQNSARGLEQSFTIDRRPAGSARRFSLLLTSSPGATAATDGPYAVAFAVGGSRLTYGGLRVTDARGRTLPARFAVSGRQVRIVVSDRGATYPLRIDPTWSASGNISLEGYSVATSDNGGVVLIGEPWSDDPTETAPAAGQVLLLIRESGGQWSAPTTLYCPTPEPSSPGYCQIDNAYFGASVAVSSDGAVAVIGAPGLDSEGYPYAFVYDLSLGAEGQATATLASFLSPPSLQSSLPDIYPSEFGTSVAAYHSSVGPVTDVFVGAPGSAVDDPDVISAGTVYEYTDPSLLMYGNGNYEADSNGTALYTDSSVDGTAIADVGASIALSPNNWVFAGAPTATGGMGTDTGALVAWNWQPWNLAQTGPGTQGGGQVTYGAEAGDLLGTSVSASPSGDVVAVGQPGAVHPYNASGTTSGGVAVFDFGGTAGADIRHPVTCPYFAFGPQTGAFDGQGYGTSVAVSDDGTTILVGAPTTGLRISYPQPGSATETPSAYVEYSAGAAYSCPGDDTPVEQVFGGTDGTYYGESVAMAGNQSFGFVTAPTYDVETAFEPGETSELIGPGPPVAATITGTPPPGLVGVPYSFGFTVGGNPAPTISVSGKLPPGLTNNGATISGTPTKAGSFSATFKASNASGHQSDAEKITIAADPPVVTQLDPVNGTTRGGTLVEITGQNLSIATAVTVDSASVPFTVVSSTELTVTAPAGSGKVPVQVTTPAGVSKVTGASQFTYSATDVAVSTTTLTSGKEHKTYSDQLTATGGSGTDVWTASGLPAGLSLSSTGLLSGKPTRTGTFDVVVEVTSGTTNDTASLTLVVT